METLQRRQLQAIAATQQSLFTVGQAAALGVTPDAIRHAVRTGWLRPVRQGVYAIAGHEPSPWEPLVAAALMAGPRAIISHRSAAAVHGFYGIVAKGTELMVPFGNRVRLTGVTVHQSRRIDPVDLTRWCGLQITTPIRTIIDLAGAGLSDLLLAKIVDEGSIARLWTAERIAARLTDMPTTGRPGMARLRRVLAERVGDGTPDSLLALKVARILKPRFGPFETNYVVVVGGEVVEMDIAWPDIKLDGEVDGLGVRRLSRTKFEREKRRANVLAAHGWRIVHFTDKMGQREIVAQVAPFFAGRIGRAGGGRGG